MGREPRVMRTNYEVLYSLDDTSQFYRPDPALNRHRALLPTLAKARAFARERAGLYTLYEITRLKDAKRVDTGRVWFHKHKQKRFLTHF